MAIPGPALRSHITAHWSRPAGSQLFDGADGPGHTTEGAGGIRRPEERPRVARALARRRPTATQLGVPGESMVGCGRSAQPASTFAGGGGATTRNPGTIASQPMVTPAGGLADAAPLCPCRATAPASLR